jgi:hypothetical protein
MPLLWRGWGGLSSGYYSKSNIRFLNYFQAFILHPDLPRPLQRRGDTLSRRIRKMVQEPALILPL